MQQLERGRDRESSGFLGRTAAVAGSLPGSIHLFVYNFCCIEQEVCISDLAQKRVCGLQVARSLESGIQGWSRSSTL